jgi:hypothetical protein
VTHGLPCYDWHTEPAVTAPHKREDARILELSNVADASSAFLSIGGHAQRSTGEWRRRRAILIGHSAGSDKIQSEILWPPLRTFSYHCTVVCLQVLAVCWLCALLLYVIAITRWCYLIGRIHINVTNVQQVTYDWLIIFLVSQVGARLSTGRDFCFSIHLYEGLRLSHQFEGRPNPGVGILCCGLVARFQRC